MFVPDTVVMPVCHHPDTLIYADLLSVLGAIVMSLQYCVKGLRKGFCNICIIIRLQEPILIVFVLIPLVLFGCPSELCTFGPQAKSMIFLYLVLRRAIRKCSI
jgi:thiol:disulfide interchange protein